jgi:2-polyprenyl-3-methyl-5-hydroxy-6-metoxy-1,4-benzoquinol methylase
MASRCPMIQCRPSVRARRGKGDRMDSERQRRVAELADLMEVAPELLPYLPELVTALDALGSWPDLIVDVLRSASLFEGAWIMDLGTGKGAVALAVAQAFPVRVEGIDAFEPFIDIAGLRAAARGRGGPGGVR